MKFGFRYFACEFTSDGWVKNIIAKSSDQVREEPGSCKVG